MDYYVLGLNFGQWFLTEDYCEKLLAHWKEKDEWLNKPPHCKANQFVVPRYMRGDPRNQAIIIREDGWNPHSTSSSFSIAAIRFTNATMSKLNRSHSSNAKVYSFIPVHQLPKDAPHKYDAFFEPLVAEIEDLYIDGEQFFLRQLSIVILLVMTSPH